MLASKDSDFRPYSTRMVTSGLISSNYSDFRPVIKQIGLVIALVTWSKSNTAALLPNWTFSLESAQTGFKNCHYCNESPLQD